MKILMMITLIAVNTFATVLNEIPDKYKDQIKITQPKNKLITINNNLKIKGRVKNGIKVSVNEKSIKTNRNGLFNQTLPLKKLGQQSIQLTFHTNNESFTIEKSFIKLKNPKTVIMTQKELAFINTSYTSKKIKKYSLSNTFKKDELAYFLEKIHTKEIDLEKKINNINKIKQYKNEIQETVNANILSLNSQGNFNPNGEVTTLFLLTGISKALDYQPSKKQYSEIIKYKNKWFYEFLHIGLDKKIISSRDLKNIKDPLSNADFIKFASRIPELKGQILAQLNFNNTPKKIKHFSIAKKQKTNIKPTIPTKVNIHAVYQLSETTKEVHGTVTPVKAFSINWRKVTPDKSGNFTTKIPYKQTKLQINFGNEILVKELPKSNRKIKIIANKAPKIIEKKPRELIGKPNTQGIQPYTDIQKHWINKIANQLKLEGKLDNTKIFNPNKKITRSDLAKYIVQINNITPKRNKKIIFKDLNSKNENYTFIQNVVSNKLLNGLSKTTFAPNEKVTKLQAIIVASRLLPDTKKYNNIILPYKDINKYKWATKSLKKAYYYKIISKSTKLNPKKSISNAELVSILYKTSKI